MISAILWTEVYIANAAPEAAFLYLSAVSIFNLHCTYLDMEWRRGAGEIFGAFEDGHRAWPIQRFFPL